MYSCPHCSKNVKNLNKHVKRMHPDQVKKEPAQEPKSPAGLQFEVKKLKEQPKHKEETESTIKQITGYHCIDCGGPLEKGQAVCSCGARLDWSAV